jgi:hypothetical protein
VMSKTNDKQQPRLCLITCVTCRASTSSLSRVHSLSFVLADEVLAWDCLCV